jgi:hypothetical protein
LRCKRQDRRAGGRCPVRKVIPNDETVRVLP